jgi:hypothetical protein
MNCKPGDLAVIVSAKGATPGPIGDVSRASIGLIGRVTRLRPPVNPSACSTALVWEFEKPMVIRVGASYYDILGCSDFDLLPIRDPGEDARDETLEWLPVPHKEIA